jgi:DnaJ-class molecular chaperone
MSKDYYKILGVEKGASKDELKKAFRKLAHEHHPDKKTGNEAKFKEINEAYQTLSDDTKRAQYDRFGSAGPNFGGQGGQGFGGFDFSGFGGFNGQGQDFEFDLNDIFGAFTGGGGGFNPFGQRIRKGRNINITTNVTFKESILGFSHKFKVPSESAMYSQKQEIEINFPPGIENGQTLKVEGYGEPLEGGAQGRPGDLLIRVSVEKHKTLRKEGANLITELKIKLTDSILGATYDVDTVDGKVAVKTPKGIKHGQMLRVRGKGVPLGTFQKGDLIIVVHLDVPEKLSKEQKKLIEELKKSGL